MVVVIVLVVLVAVVMMVMVVVVAMPVAKAVGDGGSCAGDRLSPLVREIKKSPLKRENIYDRCLSIAFEDQSS